MYFINGKQITFDELTDGHLDDLDLSEKADQNICFEDEDVYQNYFYLVEEQIHPAFFKVELENPEELPDELNAKIDEEID